jgi:hypothetical protein
MIAASRARLLEQLGDSKTVLDVGGWALPLARADWVLDLMPYETRGSLGRDGTAADERFTAATWVTRDICDRSPWPFEDGRFDFVVCSQTLEDVRDPIWVCAELQRVGRAGYVEVPSRLVEQSWWVQGPWIGYGHHRWLIDVEDGHIEFVSKPHSITGIEGAGFPNGYAQALSEEERNQALWWEGSFGFGERLFYEDAELRSYLTEFVTANLGRVPESQLARAYVPARGGLAGRLLALVRGGRRPYGARP